MTTETFQKAQNLVALAMLPALQNLEVNRPPTWSINLLGPEPYLDLLGKEFVSKLPQLVSLR